MEISKLEDINFAEFGKREKQYEKKIAEILKKTLDDIRKKMAMIYEKYAKDGVLTKADMTRYNRLVSLEKNIVDLVRPGIKQAQQIVDRLRPEEYSEGFFRSGWSIDEASKVSLNWAPVNKELITKSLDNTFFHTASKLFSQKSLSRIQNAINQGLIDGKSYATMIKDLKTSLNQSNYEIMRWLRTEMGAAYSAGSSDAYDSALKQGIQGSVIWDAALERRDGRTRPTHAAMDGVKRSKDGLFHGAVGTTPYPKYEGMVAAERINCRCSIRFQIDGFESALRREKEGGVIPYQTYTEWLKGRKIFK